MNMKNTKKRIPAMIMAAGLVGMAAALALSLVTGCASSPKKQAKEAARQREAAIAALKPIQTIPEKRPSWVDSVPITNKMLSFVGVSNQYATDAEARNEAQGDGRGQLVKYYGTLISDKGRKATATYGITSDVFDPQVASQELEEFVAEGLAKGLPAKEFYTEVYFTQASKNAFKVYALMQIDKEQADKAMQEYCNQKAAEYQSKAEAEKDAEKRRQLEKTSELFGGMLQPSLF